ncbi:MAG: site-specific integrase [Pseudomonadota bacterium]
MIRSILPKLTSHTTRREFPYRKEPYWGLIEYGRAMGFLKKGPKECYWVARCRTPEGGYRFHRLARSNQGVRADGKTIMTYTQARAAADKWFELQEKIGAAAPAKPFGLKLTLDLENLREDAFTVAHAMIDYVAWKKLAASPSYFVTVISHSNTYILPLIGNLPAQEMTGVHFQEWVKTCLEMVPRRGAKRIVGKLPIERMSAETLRKRKKTINCVITMLRDALQMAWDNGKIDNDRAFRTFRRFAHSEAARVLFLSREEAKRLLEAANPDLRNLMLGALYSGCRSGELLNLKVSDVAREGYGLSIVPFKTRNPRFVFLPDEGMAFFLALTKGKDTNAPLFLRSNGEEWGVQHRYYFRLAVKAAGLPKEFSFHGLRHTYASQLIQAGAPLQAVADQLGHTNIVTVSRTYAHFAPQIRESEVRQRFRSIDTRMKRRASRMRNELTQLRIDLYGGDGSSYAAIADLKTRRRDRDKFGINHPTDTPELLIPDQKIKPTRGADGKATRREMKRIMGAYR